MKQPFAVLASLATLAGCGMEPAHKLEVDGDAQRGAHLLRSHECGVCHVIPAIPGAHGRVGPSLENYRRKSYVAGKFPNTPVFLATWIMDPTSMTPNTAMPDMNIDARDARDIAAYLYTLD